MIALVVELKMQTRKDKSPNDSKRRLRRVKKANSSRATEARYGAGITGQAIHAAFIITANEVFFQGLFCRFRREISAFRHTISLPVMRFDPSQGEARQTWLSCN
jgi:hypothetical protein